MFKQMKIIDLKFFDMNIYVEKHWREVFFVINFTSNNQD